MKKLDGFIKGANDFLNYFIYIVLAVTLVFGGYSLWNYFQIYNGTKLDREILKYRPSEDDRLSLSELQKINPDIKGWIKIENTMIDYPVVQGKDNFEYLNLDYKRDYSLSGSIFLDYRNSPDFSDKQNIIFGHNVNGNLMFADVRAYRYKWFFDQNKIGYLYTKDKNYKFEVFSYLEADSFDSTIYNVSYNKKKLTKQLISKIKNNSKQYRDINLKESDSILMLSTCIGDSRDRSIAVAKVIK